VTGELERRTDVADISGRFVWYELMTTDATVAKVFYAKVVGWDAQDASTSNLAYTVLASGKAQVSGLMELPPDARKMGATPRWMAYVGVSDVKATAERIARLGGAIYVSPTDTNIGRIAVVADPQMATLGLVEGLKGEQQLAEMGKPGRVGWHELLAADLRKAFAFYSEVFGWQKANAEIGPTNKYQLFSAGGQTIGGMFTKRREELLSFWLYYINVDDVDAALERVKAGGGSIFEGPMELSGEIWIARCRDPQGAAFALQGKRGPASEVGWSVEWGNFSSRGRLQVSKPPRRSD
jgi:predicted enzyme related to lactoylglutathione lyase